MTIGENEDDDKWETTVCMCVLLCYIPNGSQMKAKWKRRDHILCDMARMLLSLYDIATSSYLLLLLPFSGSDNTFPKPAGN